ncbi:hypothetical protein [Xanthomonas theicola]|uniref:hypothetical protein n=1 Tax=Xanthomonas theicola TaxID=56464 RepID=UPI0011AFE85C|nr:hypothetical protein [Xanthomonas theicola]QNH26128.1 hypothetical protein G4Q83_17180 [Xanthomonas theicola]
MGIGSFMNDATVRQAFQKFSQESEEPKFLIMTPPRIVGLGIQIVTCYVTCSVSPAMRVSAAPLVSRPRPGKGGGRIVDYVDHSWDMEEFVGSTI